MAAARLLLPLLLLVLLSPSVLSLDLHLAAQRASSLFSATIGDSKGVSTSSTAEEENPMHVFRDASTGNLVESAEPTSARAHATVTSLGENDKAAAAAAAAALARKLDELYLDDVAVRTRKVHIRGTSSSSSSSGVAAALFFGRKGGMSSTAAGAADDNAAAVKAGASSSSSAASGGVSASSSAIPSSRAQARSSKRSRLLSFN